MGVEGHAWGRTGLCFDLGFLGDMAKLLHSIHNAQVLGDLERVC